MRPIERTDLVQSSQARPIERALRIAALFCVLFSFSFTQIPICSLSHGFLSCQMHKAKKASEDDERKKKKKKSKKNKRKHSDSDSEDDERKSAAKLAKVRACRWCAPFWVYSKR